MGTERTDKIKEFLSRFFRNHDLRPDEDIFALGFVNSLLAMQLVQFVEKEFGIRGGGRGPGPRQLPLDRDIDP